MRRPQTSIAGMLVLVACISVVLGILEQPYEVLVALLTLALLVVPAASIILRFGPRRRWLAARDLLRTFLLGLWIAIIGLLTLALSLLLPIAATVILFRAATRPLDAAVLMAVVSTALALLSAMSLAAFGLGPRKAFGWGFAVLGWPYLLVSLAPIASQHAPDLLTTHLLHAAYSNVYIFVYPAGYPPHPTVHSGPWAYQRYQRVGHCLIGLSLGSAGGFMARALALRGESLRNSDVHSATQSRDFSTQASS